MMNYPILLTSMYFRVMKATGTVVTARALNATQIYFLGMFGIVVDMGVQLMCTTLVVVA